MLANNDAIEGAYSRTLEALGGLEYESSGDVPAAKQTALLQGFVAELSDLLHFAQMDKSSRYDPVSLIFTPFYIDNSVNPRPTPP
jgi:hypothetical protein